MIVLIRSNGINPDPRVQKYIDFLTQTGKGYKVLAWDRNGDAPAREDFIYFHRKAEYGRRHRNIPNQLMWFVFVVVFLFKEREHYTLVHACDFDTAFPTAIAGLFTRKPFIFDVFDWIGHGEQKGFFFRVVRFSEKWAANRADFLIICEEERKQQLPIRRTDILVMPNIPNTKFVFEPRVQETVFEQRKRYDTVLSYVGVFDRDRGLEDLLAFVEEYKNVCLNIAGFGFLENTIKEYAKRNDNIEYWGKVDYNVGLNIMGAGDLIMAMYYKSFPPHIFAAPNKFYEGLMLGVPTVTTRGTLIGDRTLRYDTGFVINEGGASISALLASGGLSMEIDSKIVNCSKVWESIYKDAVTQFLEKEYAALL